MELWQNFLAHDGKLIHKWTHYFGAYERHFAGFRGKSMTFLEIGVSEGGSLQMWQRYFGPYARIVGIDIDPACKAHEGPGLSVRIGSQSDPAFLARVIEEFGVPDVVLDDGSHRMGDIEASFSYLYPKLPKNGVYMVEDLHTAFWPEFGGGLHAPSNFINRCKGLIDSLNADHTRGAIAPDAFTRSTASLSFYDSVVVIEKGDIWRKESVQVAGAGRSGVPDASSRLITPVLKAQG